MVDSLNLTYAHKSVWFFFRQIQLALGIHWELDTEPHRYKSPKMLKFILEVGFCFVSAVKLPFGVPTFLIKSLVEISLTPLLTQLSAKAHLMSIVTAFTFQALAFSWVMPSLLQAFRGIYQ